MSASFFTSMLAVASSMRMMRAFLKTALQMQISCFYPADRLLLQTLPSMPPLEVTMSKMLHSCMTFQSCQSEQLLNMSRFQRKVELRRMGSWSITVMAFLRFLRGIWVSGMSSNKISPSHISVNYKRVLRMVDFPEPVLPTTPTFSPSLITNCKPFNTLSNSFLYLTDTFLN